MGKRTAWVVVFVVSCIAYSVIVTFGSWWSVILALPVLVAGISSFGYIYARGTGVDTPREPAPPRED